ncbi:Stage V sporulation protein B [Candidatus Hydrogenisulfobacillus filiaventi]|uniref:Stage V sporulation protein B n=1 Tax=Candidatus Hydrogenisulfobacillus filiaventi TaxID=2707344 RepID=A0A6F8ZHM4_9FIRM|nr:polysaccharide biosynthesis protein [Bacillota bacterium]CAB1129152.1 Stage V sporulation protein B [Candidatus Hydrogenisulfobacillus filiaventi]
MSTRRSLWRSTVTLTAAAVLSRAFGLVYRMLLARFLGARGLGVFQMVFPLYVSVVTLAAAGIPVALAQLIAERPGQERVLVAGGRRLLAWTSVPIFLALVLTAVPIAAHLYHDARFAPLMLALSPSVLLVSAGALLRGYFVGRQEMAVPAGAQVAEQAGRVAVLAALLALGDRGRGRFGPAPLIAALLIPAGDAISLAWLYRGFRRQPPQGPAGDVREAVRRLWRLSLPIAASRLSGALIGLAEAILIPARLQAGGMSEAAAVAFFGQLTGTVLPLIFFPTALAISLSTALVPAVADASGRHDPARLGREAEQALAATAFLSFPLTIVLAVLGPAFDTLLFAAHVSRPIFTALAVGGLFLYFDITISGILRGLGRTGIPMRNDLLASLVELGLIAVLGARPGQGPLMVAGAVALGFALSALLDLAALLRLLPVRLHWRRALGPPAAASFPLLLALPLWLRFFPRALPGIWTLAAAVGLAAAVFLAGLRASRFRLSKLT